MNQVKQFPQKIFAAYGAVGGNAPALSCNSVGHLRAAIFYYLLKITCHEQFQRK